MSSGMLPCLSMMSKKASKIMAATESDKKERNKQGTRRNETTYRAEQIEWIFWLVGNTLALKLLLFSLLTCTHRVVAASTKSNPRTAKMRLEGSRWTGFSCNGHRFMRNFVEIGGPWPVALENCLDRNASQSGAKKCSTATEELNVFGLR